VGAVGPDATVLDVPDAVAEALLYPATDLVTEIEVETLEPKPVTVTVPVEEFTEYPVVVDME
jgi:hypothetical protein